MPEKFKITFHVGSVYEVIIEAEDDWQAEDFKYELSERISREALRAGKIGSLAATFVGEIVDCEQDFSLADPQVSIVGLEHWSELPAVIHPMPVFASSWVEHGPGWSDAGENDEVVEDKHGRQIDIGDTVAIIPAHYGAIDLSGDAIGLLGGMWGEVVQLRSYDYEKAGVAFGVVIDVENVGQCVVDPNDLEVQLEHRST